MSLQYPINQDLADALIQRPLWFSFGRGRCIKRYAIYPPTLGKRIITASLILRLGIDAGIADESLALESLRLASVKRVDAVLLIAYYTLNDRDSILDSAIVARRAEQLDKGITTQELAELLIHVLTLDTSDALIATHGIDTDLELRQRIADVKGNGSGVLVGSKTIYGALIDQVAERYGWTIDYILWGISYVNLKMLISDAPTYIPISEEEARRLGINVAGVDIIDANDPANAEDIARMFNE